MKLIGRRRVLKSCGWEGNHNSDLEVGFCAFLHCGLFLWRLRSNSRLDRVVSSQNVRSHIRLVVLFVDPHFQNILRNLENE
jgi:hypothetical protein